MIPGLTAKTVEGAGAFAYPLIFLPFISSAFVPTESMPGPVRAFAEHQPVTSIVDAIRDLFAQQPVGGTLGGSGLVLGHPCRRLWDRDVDLSPQDRLRQSEPMLTIGRLAATPA